MTVKPLTMAGTIGTNTPLQRASALPGTGAIAPTKPLARTPRLSGLQADPTMEGLAAQLHPHPQSEKW